MMCSCQLASITWARPSSQTGLQDMGRPIYIGLVVSFLEAVKWYHIAVLYDVLLPIGIYYLGKTILANRPTGYGQTDIGKNPQFEKYKKIPFRIGKKELLVSPLFVSLSVGMLLVFI